MLESEYVPMKKRSPPFWVPGSELTPPVESPKSVPEFVPSDVVPSDDDVSDVDEPELVPLDDPASDE